MGIDAKEKGIIPEAVSFFMKSIQKDISFIPAMIELAILYDDLEEFDKAISFYQRSLKLDPNHYELRIHYANALIRNNQVDNGLQEIRKALELDENNPDGWYYLAITYFFYLKETEKALAIANRIILMDPDYLSGYTLLGEVQFSLGNVGSAVKSFQKALQIDSMNKDAHLALSAIFGNDLRDRKKSLKHSLFLLDKDPGDLLARHNAEMALKLPASDKTPQSDQALEEGMAYLYLEKWDLAEHALKRALRLNPSHPRVWKMLQKVRSKSVTV